MSIQANLVPFDIINGLDGKPLVNGYVYIGVENLDPITNPVQVFYDQNLTIPAAQPLRTIGGYISRNGSPAKIYVSGNYSVLVKTQNNVQVYYSASSALGNGLNQDDALFSIATYSLLRAYAGTATLFYVAGRTDDQDGAAGTFAVDEADTTSADNDGTILVDALGRRWKRQNVQSLNPLWFDSAANFTSAMNKCIAICNATLADDRAGWKGNTIYIPDGRYTIISALNPITVSGVTIKGQSSTGTTLVLPSGVFAFTYGDATKTRSPVFFGFKSLKLEYTSTPALGSVILNIDNGNGATIDDLKLENVGKLLRLGESATRIAGGVTVTNVKGSSANAGIPLFDLRFGAGLELSNVAVFVRGVLPPTHPASMTTLVNTNVFECSVGFWDTLTVTNCLFERYNTGVGISATTGKTYQNFFFSATVFDYCKRWAIFIDVSGGIASTIVSDDTCWFVSWEESGIFVNAPVGYCDNIKIRGIVTIAGKFGLFYNCPSAKNNNFDNLLVNSCNRLNLIQGAINFAAGSVGFSANGARGNNDTTSAGLPWRAPYGIVIANDCDNFSIQNCSMEGSSGGYSVGANSASSKNRIVANNLNANYSGNQASSVPASGVDLINRTPFNYEYSFFGGTITGGYSKNGFGYSGALQYNYITLSPSDRLQIGYSVAPGVLIFIKP